MVSALAAKLADSACARSVVVPRTHTARRSAAQYIAPSSDGTALARARTYSLRRVALRDAVCHPVQPRRHHRVRSLTASPSNATQVTQITQIPPRSPLPDRPGKSADKRYQRAANGDRMRNYKALAGGAASVGTRTVSDDAKPRRAPRPPAGRRPLLRPHVSTTWTFSRMVFESRTVDLAHRVGERARKADELRNAEADEKRRQRFDRRAGCQVLRHQIGHGASGAGLAEERLPKDATLASAPKKRFVARIDEWLRAAFRYLPIHHMERSHPVSDGKAGVITLATARHDPRRTASPTCARGTDGGRRGLRHVSTGFASSLKGWSHRQKRKGSGRLKAMGVNHEIRPGKTRSGRSICDLHHVGPFPASLLRADYATRSPLNCEVRHHGRRNSAGA